MKWLDLDILERDGSRDLNGQELAELLELTRLARLGLWFEAHSNSVEGALNYALSNYPVSKISPYEKALDLLNQLKDGRQVKSRAAKHKGHLV